MLENLRNVLDSKYFTTVRIDEVNADLRYLGFSEKKGILDTEPEWIIAREIKNGTQTILEFAGGTPETNQWTWVGRTGYFTAAPTTERTGTFPANADTVAVVLHAPLNQAASMQIIWAGLDDVDAVIKLRGSKNGTDWSDLVYAGVGSKTLDSPADSQLFEIPKVSYEFINIAYDKGSNTTGTITWIWG